MRAQNYVEGDFGHAGKRSLTPEHHVWLAIAFFGPLTLGVWGTTQWFASEFGYAAALGPTLEHSWGTTPLYAPWRIFEWLLTLENEPLQEAQRARAYLFLSGVASVVTLLLTLANFARELRNRSDEVHDSGRFGTPEELEAQGLLSDGYPKDGIVLGTYTRNLNAPVRDTSRMRHVVDNSDTPVAIAGPPGSGKNVVIVTPTLLAWRGSALVIDPKLESYELTSGYRAKVLGQRVGILDFINSDRSLGFNFLDFIRVGADYEVRDALNTAIYLVDSSGKGLDDARMEHWVQTPAGLLAAAALHVMYRAKREKWGRSANIFDVAWELSGRNHPAVLEAIQREVELLTEAGKPVPSDPSKLVDPTAEVLRSWLSYQHAESEREGWSIPGGTTRTHLFVQMRAQEQLDRMNTPEGSGHLSSVRKVLTLFEDPHIQRVTSRSDFALDDLQALEVASPEGPKNGLTLYFPIPLADFKRLRPIYRTFLCQATSRLTERQKKKHERRRLLYLLDEFPILGKLDILFNLFGVGRGYGIKPVILFQTFGQIDEVWGEAAARALIDNAETLVAMTPAPGATSTAAKLSDMAGRITLTAESRSRSLRAGGGGMASSSESHREVVRPLLTKVEIMTLPRTTHKTDAKGRDVCRPDGTVVLERPGIQLLYRKNIPVVKILQIPHYADREYLRRTRIAPPALMSSSSGTLRSTNASADSAPDPATRLRAPETPSGGWQLPPPNLFPPLATLPPEDASALLDLLREALLVHGIDAHLGDPLCGPREIVVPLESQLEAIAPLALELAACVGRPLELITQPFLAIALQRSTPCDPGFPALVACPRSDVEIPIGLDALGAPVVATLSAAKLAVQGDAQRAIETWLALLVLEFDPSTLAIDVLIEDLYAPWPHVTRWDAESYEQALRARDPKDTRVRIAVADRTLQVEPEAVILWTTESTSQEPAFRLHIDTATGTAMFSHVDGTCTRLLLPTITSTERDALARHWSSFAEQSHQAFAPANPTEIDDDALLLELAGIDEV